MMSEPTDWEALQTPFSSDEDEGEIDAIIEEELHQQPKPRTYLSKKKFAQGRLALYRLC